MSDQTHTRLLSALVSWLVLPPLNDAAFTRARFMRPSYALSGSN
ncbi:MAG: hypothetical protein ACKVIU_09700 [Rhodobacterales bacterium]